MVKSIDEIIAFDEHALYSFGVDINLRWDFDETIQSRRLSGAHQTLNFCATEILR